MRRALALLGLTALAFAPARAELLEELEPDDQPAQAQPLLPAASVGGVVSFPGDRDLYAVRLDVAQTLRADILARGFRADTNPGSSLSARLRILDGDGATMLAEDRSQGSFDDPAVALKVFVAGVYYIEVADLAGTGSAGHVYVLSVEVDDNDTFDRATRIAPPVLPSIDALIWPAGDHDVYRFDATAGTVATLDVDSAVFNPTVPPVKAVLTLYRPDRTVLATDAYSASDPNDPWIRVTLPVDGTYYVEVRELRSFVGTDNSFYQLSVELGPFTSNDTVAGATPIVPPRGVSGVLSPQSDLDHYAFSLPQTSTVTLDVDAQEGLLSLLDGTVTLLTGGGTLVASDAGSPDPRLTATAGPGPLVARVGGSSTGLPEDAYYRLIIDPDPDGDGILLPRDVCPMASDPSQADGDHDGVGDACDVCVAVFNPGQERNLRVQEPVGETLAVNGAGWLSWSPALDAAGYDVYRGSVTGAGHAPLFTCLLDNVTAETAQDPAAPPPGGVFVYLVSAENCGESPAGEDASGNPVPIPALCPLSL